MEKKDIDRTANGRARVFLGFALGLVVGVGGMFGIAKVSDLIREAYVAEETIEFPALSKAMNDYHAQHDSFLFCGPVPKTPPAEQMDWPGDPCFDRLGFKPQSPIHQSYSTFPVGGDSFLVLAVFQPDPKSAPQISVQLKDGRPSSL